VFRALFRLVVCLLDFANTEVRDPNRAKRFLLCKTFVAQPVERSVRVFGRHPALGHFINEFMP